MANLPETPQWEEGIYQIEVSDPVLGGPDGISNRQGKQLASRTLYLKQQVEKGGSELAKHIAAADPHTQYAPKASPTFTGTPTAPTPANSDNSKKLATTEFVAKALAALAGSAPETLDTLKELADALGNDPNFATTVLNKLAEKLAKDQHGADIPDPALFVKNLGLVVTDLGKNIISAPTKVDVLSYLGITTALDGKQPLDATLTALAALAGVADKLPYFNGADTAALTDLTAYARGLLGAPDAADSRSYLGLKSAATKDVGSGAGQVPDMSSWVSGGSPTTGWRKTPDGYIEQWGLTGATTTDVTINFPIPFPTALISINEHDMTPSGESLSMWQFRGVTLNNCVAVNLGTLIRGNPSLGSPVASGCRWFAKGV